MRPRRSPAGVTGAHGFDRRIEREQVGLFGNRGIYEDTIVTAKLTTSEKKWEV
jgi:hypothetical protein